MVHVHTPKLPIFVDPAPKELKYSFSLSRQHALKTDNFPQNIFINLNFLFSSDIKFKNLLSLMLFSSSSEKHAVIIRNVKGVLSNSLFNIIYAYICKTCLIAS